MFYLLIMTFLAVVPANGVHSYLFDLPALQLFMHLFVAGIEIIIEELYFCITVAFDTPAHAEIFHLRDAVHLLHIPVAFSTVKFSNIHMLGMIEVHMVRQVVYTYPFNRDTGPDRIVDLADFELA